MTMSKITYSLSLLLAIAASADGFAPTAVQSIHPTSTSALHVSVVSGFLTKDEADAKITHAFETETPASVGMQEITSPPKSKKGKRRNKRKHNFAATQEFREEKPDTDFYTLHSSAVSHLQKDMPINDIIRAIKRAQNLHDFHDMGTIAAFLIDECDEHWGYGFRGSLLSRLAVAALHMKAVDVASRAINARRVHERPSMQPYESAAIVRGLMRTNQMDKAWIVLEDELRLPMEGADLTTPENREMLKHRARTLASIVSRHFHNGEPFIAARALAGLESIGTWIDESDMEGGESNLPWSRLINAASVVKADAVSTCQYVDSSIEVPSDLTELVFSAMAEFPCPGGEEECSLDDFLVDEVGGRSCR